MQQGGGFQYKLAVGLQLFQLPDEAGISMHLAEVFDIVKVPPGNLYHFGGNLGNAHEKGLLFSGISRHAYRERATSAAP